MPTILRVLGFRFFFYSLEAGEPPRVHVAHGGKSAKYWLDPVELANSDGFRQANRTSDLLACDKNACPIRFGSILPPCVSNKLGRSRWIGSLRASKAWMTQGAGTPPCMISMLF